MNIELTIQAMFDECSALFQTRQSCLDYLFCVTENGYEWENGELIYQHPELRSYGNDISVLESHLVDGKAYQHRVIDTDKKMFMYYAEKDLEKGDMPSYRVNKEIADSIDENDKKLINETLNEEWKWHLTKDNFHKDYAFLWNYPEDIKEDYKKAIEECKELLRADGFDIDEYDKDMDCESERE